MTLAPARNSLVPLLALGSGIAVADNYYLQPLLALIGHDLGVGIGAMGVVSSLALLGYALLLFFAYCISWIMAFFGLLVRTPEVFNNVTFIVIFPLTFIANTFVPLESFPGPLRWFASWNPVSMVTQASREMFGNLPAGTPDPSGWAMQNPVVYTVAWGLAILVVFVPLTVRQYQRAAAR